MFDTTVLGMPENTPADEYFADCEVTVTGRFLNQRVAPCPLEVRGAAAAWIDGRLHQWVSTQHAQGIKATYVAANGVDDADVRVLTPDVGGGFGAKIGSYPEELMLGPIAKRIGRPVRWRETRSESMMALGHGRAQLQYVTLGGSRDGKVTHYQLHAIQDAGGFCDMGAILAPFMTRPMSSGVYAIPNIEVRTTSVVTNTTPIVAYRGAGRPEATAAIERGMDLFAAEIGMDAAEVRRINLIPKFLESYTTTIGQTYDVGDYETALDKALEAAGYTELRAEQAKRRESGDDKQLGIGVSVYVEITGGVPPAGDNAKIEVHDDGSATVYTGTSPHGQGHDTAWSMITTERTGIPMDRITLVWGDTDLVPEGGGTMGSRSLQHGGSAVNKAARRTRREGPETGRRTARSRRGRHRARQGCRRVPRRRHPDRVEDLGRTRRIIEGRRPADHRHRLQRQRRLVPVRCSRVGRRGRHRSPDRSSTSARSPATTPDASSTRCCSKARSTAASPRGRRKRCSKRCATTTTATRSRPTSPTTG